jgi:hypothetical protein
MSQGKEEVKKMNMMNMVSMGNISQGPQQVNVLISLDRLFKNLIENQQKMEVMVA